MTFVSWYSDISNENTVMSEEIKTLPDKMSNKNSLYIELCTTNIRQKYSHQTNLKQNVQPMTIFIILLGMVSIRCALPNKSVSQSKWFNFPKLSPLKLTPQKHIIIHKYHYAMACVVSLILGASNWKNMVIWAVLKLMVIQLSINQIQFC